MSLLGAVIAWLLRGLLRRPAPALARSAAGYWAGAQLSPECAAEAVAWQHATVAPLLFWPWSDPAWGRCAAGSRRRRISPGLFDQWVRRL
ncbi:MAG: hypothetical protein U0992_16770 [Planctomycetaceae bacterium]